MRAADVGFHPEAVAEAAAAVEWYAARSPDAAERFEREIRAAVERIAEAPDRWPPHGRLHRKLPLRRFPYVLIYRSGKERLWIMAVAHGHRRPGYWKSRQPPAAPTAPPP